MSMNIKNEEAHRLAQQLAALTGESMTEAVTQSLRERLERIQELENASLSERLLVLGKRCARHLKTSLRCVDHGDLLYGSDGLPE
jgi:antitoxin VapB